MHYRSPRLRCGFFFGWVILGTALMACGDSTNNASQDGGAGPDAAAAEGCTVVAPTACPTPAVVYADIQPIVQQRCLSCHSGNTDQWPLTTYYDLADWYSSVRDNVLTCDMPPPTSGIPMTNEERTKILQWVLCGYKQ